MANPASANINAVRETMDGKIKMFTTNLCSLKMLFRNIFGSIVNVMSIVTGCTLHDSFA